MGKGSEFEAMIEKANRVYADNSIALIQKVATPTAIHGNKMFFQRKSTVDFVGIVDGGRMVAFDAKSCAMSSFRLSRIKKHQMQYVLDVIRLGGIGFFLIWMQVQKKVYMLIPTSRFMLECWDKGKDTFKIADLDEYCRELHGWETAYPRLNYLSLLAKVDA